ncbi:hypothetical protein ACQUQP_05880 [Marinobacterium sp. YM272]|uniref:hypothetical protein n=1 Tax=Marinobacterium sp. YM272 TaxID=3421654 RepID=UPI003D7F8F0C
MKNNTLVCASVFKRTWKGRSSRAWGAAIIAALCGGFVVWPSAALAIGKPDRSAIPQVTIIEVQVDFDDSAGDLLVIRGENFDIGSLATVSLGSVVELEVLAQSSTEITAACPAPDYLCPVGDYLLRVSTGDSASENDVYALTIGAVGPAGPAGEQGIQGPSGVAAAGAGLVGTGTPDNLTLSVDYPNLVTPSGIQIESTGDAVRVRAKGGSVVINPDGSIQIESSESVDVVSTRGNIDVQATQGAITMKAAQSISFAVGNQELRIDPGKVSLKGAQVDIQGGAAVNIRSTLTTVQGDGILSLEGGVVKIN